MDECDHPSGPKRRESIRNREVDAIFDEGLTRWLDEALANGYEVLHLTGQIIKAMVKLGFKRSVIPKKKFPKLREDVRTLDFSGWPLITHRWLRDETAYAICEAIHARRHVIPVDNGRVDMKSLCRDTDDAPWEFPFTQGPENFTEKMATCRGRRPTCDRSVD